MKQTASNAQYAGNDDLEFYIHDDGAASFRFEIEGSLYGRAAREVDQAWRTASSIIGDRTLVIGVGSLTSVDPFGCPSSGMARGRRPLRRQVFAGEDIDWFDYRPTADASGGNRQM